jgi:hypothetical protein
VITRREFVKVLSAGVALSGTAINSAEVDFHRRRVEISPYVWEGPYSEYRKNAKHDWRLCAEVRAPWMSAGERIIIRSSEEVGYEKEFLYDDHFPPAEPERRGKDYKHVPFTWNSRKSASQGLVAHCNLPGKGGFWLRLSPGQDFVDITLGIRNGGIHWMDNIDWLFCVVGYECPSIADPQLTRTYLLDNRGLRALAELSTGPNSDLFKVVGSEGRIPTSERNQRVGPIEAKASVVIVESVDGRHSAALGFEQSCAIYSNTGNRCFHADPYFRPFKKEGEERIVRGKLYLIEGTAQDALKRYLREFGNPSARD